MESLELQTAKEAALLAGSELKGFASELNITFKGQKDIVTEADILSQSIIIEKIKSVFPNDNIMAEESTSNSYNGDRMWVIDPLDGTVNFAHNIPLFGISIALVENNQIKLGVTYLPLLGELYYAEKGKGSYCNEKRIKVSNNNDANEAIINISDFNAGYTQEMDKLNQAKMELVKCIHGNCMRLKIFSSAVLEMAYIATGRIDAYFIMYCGFWDIAAGIILVEEAGGKVTDFSGNPVDINTKLIIASNEFVHDKYLNLIKNKVVI